MSASSGVYNRRIDIQYQTVEQDEFGQPLSTWTSAYKCWASISIKNGKLIYSTAEFMDKITHIITIKWPFSIVIAASQRVVFYDYTTKVKHVYEIEAVMNTNQANKELVLFAYELGGKE